MRRSPWSLSIAGLAAGGLGLVGGTAIGGELGPLTAGYGLLVVLGALHAIAVLAARHRPSGRQRSALVETLAARRFF